MKHIGIVLAGGSGTRMGGNVPKQYLELGDKPILAYSLLAMENSFIDEIILVVKDGDISYCEDIVKRYNISKVSKIVTGGETRSHSVYEGLKNVSDSSSYVYIQDGARPFLTKDILERAKDDVCKYKASVAGVPSKDTVKISDESGMVVSTPKRDNVWIVQTPQVFEYGLIKASYDKLMAEKTISATDDAMVLEAYSSEKVHLFLGDYTNIKITTFDDLEVAKNILKII